MLHQRVPALGREAEGEALDRLARQPALGDVASPVVARGHVQQDVGVEGRGLLVEGEDALARLVAAGIAHDAALEGHAGARRELFEGVGEVEPLGLDQPGEGVALLAATEADVVAALGVDVERGRPLGVEGAQALPVLAGALQLHLRADQFEDIDALADLDDVTALGHLLPPIRGMSHVNISIILIVRTQYRALERWRAMGAGLVHCRGARGGDCRARWPGHEVSGPRECAG